MERHEPDLKKSSRFSDCEPLLQSQPPLLLVLFSLRYRLGVGIAAIAAGIFAVVAALNSAQKRAEQISNSMQISLMRPRHPFLLIVSLRLPRVQLSAQPRISRRLGDQKAGINIETPAFHDGRSL